MEWSEEALLDWRESLAEMGVAGESSDPMFAEFVSAEKSREAEAESWSESLDPDFSAAMNEYADRPVGPWDLDPGWSPWAEEEEEEERLSALEEWVSSNAEEGVVSVVSPVDMSVGESSVAGPGEGVVASGGRSEAEAVSSLSRWEAGVAGLREGVSEAVVDAFGDRVDPDGREARGLVRDEDAAPGDGRRYWWALSVWCREIGVEDWRAAFASCPRLEGLAICHDKDGVDPHVQAVLRRPRGLKSSRKNMEREVCAWLGCPASCLSLSMVDDTRAAVSYLVHESAIGKHIYGREEVVSSGSVSLESWLSEAAEDWVAVVSAMQFAIDDVLARRGRVSFRGFLSWCHVERPDWWRVLVVRRSARMYIRDYLRD